MKLPKNVVALVVATVATADAFAPQQTSSTASSTQLHGLFDKFIAGGSGRDRLDEEVRFPSQRACHTTHLSFDH
jgi:hypothetical protein